MGEYDMHLKEWANLLNGIVEKFIDQMTGKVDRVFWNQIINKESGYRFGGSGMRMKADVMTGWLAIFFS